MPTVEDVSRAPGIVQLALTISQRTARTGNAVNIDCDPCTCFFRDLDIGLLESLEAGLFANMGSLHTL